MKFGTEILRSWFHRNKGPKLLLSRLGSHFPPKMPIPKCLFPNVYTTTTRICIIQEVPFTLADLELHKRTSRVAALIIIEQ
jgi:hypothetical protein